MTFLLLYSGFSFFGLKTYEGRKNNQQRTTHNLICKYDCGIKYYIQKTDLATKNVSLAFEIKTRALNNGFKNNIGLQSV